MLMGVERFQYMCLFILPVMQYDKFKIFIKMSSIARHQLVDINLSTLLPSQCCILNNNASPAGIHYGPFYCEFSVF